MVQLGPVPSARPDHDIVLVSKRLMKVAVTKMHLLSSKHFVWRTEAVKALVHSYNGFQCWHVFMRKLNIYWDFSNRFRSFSTIFAHNLVELCEPGAGVAARLLSGELLCWALSTDLSRLPSTFVEASASHPELCFTCLGLLSKAASYIGPIQ